MHSTPQVRTDLFRRRLEKTLLTDFFGSIRNIELLNMSTGQTFTSRKSVRDDGVCVEEEACATIMPPASLSPGYSSLVSVAPSCLQ